MSKDFYVSISFFLLQKGITNDEIMSIEAPCFPTYQKGQTIFLQRENHAIDNPDSQPVIRNMGSLKQEKYTIVDIHHSIYEIIASHAKLMRDGDDIVTKGISTNCRVEVYVEKSK